MQQIDWSNAPSDATIGGQDDNWFYFYKDITPEGCKYWQVCKSDSRRSSVDWQSVVSQPSGDPLITRPYDVDKLNLIAIMKDRATTFWGAGSCITLPQGWAWVAAGGMHPHYDILKRSVDDMVVVFQDVYAPPDLIPVTKLNKTRDEALAWCVANLDIWYAKPKSNPEGWLWIKVDGSVRLYPENHKGLSITRSQWSAVKHATPFTLNYPGENDVSSRPSDDGVPLETAWIPGEAQSAINTLNRMDYTYNGGQLWKPPIGKAVDFIEYDNWNVGDKCWVSNEKGYDIAERQVELLGFDITSTVVSLFAPRNGPKMVIVQHDNGPGVMWHLDMLKRPLNKRDKVLDTIRGKTHVEIAEMVVDGLGDNLT